MLGDCCVKQRRSPEKILVRWLEEDKECPGRVMGPRESMKGVRKVTLKNGIEVRLLGKLIPPIPGQRYLTKL